MLCIINISCLTLLDVVYVCLMYFKDFFGLCCLWGGGGQT